LNLDLILEANSPLVEFVEVIVIKIGNATKNGLKLTLSISYVHVTQVSLHLVRITFHAFL